MSENKVEAVQTSNDSVFNGEREVTVGDIRKHIPAHLFVKNEARFFVSVFFSLSLTFFVAFLADRFIPLTLAALPLWIIYAAINGTIATGLWVSLASLSFYQVNSLIFLSPC